MASGRETYVYAGFRFYVDGQRLTPAPGQHRSAYQDKHRRAAEFQYEQDCARGWAQANDPRRDVVDVGRLYPVIEGSDGE